MNGVQLQHGSRSKASCYHIPVQDAVSGRNTHHLLSGHADRLDAELAVAHVEQVLQVGTEQVNNEDVVEALLTEVVDLGNTRYVSRARVSAMIVAPPLYTGFKETRTSAVQRPVRAILVAQLGSLRLARFLVQRVGSVSTVCRMSSGMRHVRI